MVVSSRCFCTSFLGGNKVDERTTAVSSMVNGNIVTNARNKNMRQQPNMHRPLLRFTFVVSPFDPPNPRTVDSRYQGQVKSGRQGHGLNQGARRSKWDRNRIHTRTTIHFIFFIRGPNQSRLPVGGWWEERVRLVGRRKSVRQ